MVRYGTSTVPVLIRKLIPIRSIFVSKKLDTDTIRSPVFRTSTQRSGISTGTHQFVGKIGLNVRVSWKNKAFSDETDDDKYLYVYS